MHRHTERGPAFDLRRPDPLPLCLRLLANPNLWGGDEGAGGPSAKPDPPQPAQELHPSSHPGGHGHPQGQGPDRLHLLGGAVEGAPQLRSWVPLLRFVPPAPSCTGLGKSPSFVRCGG